MKQTWAILMVFLVLLQCSTKTIIVTHYLLNKDIITERLCENKEKPALKCEGKCYLSKKLKSEERNENKSASEFKLFPDFYCLNPVFFTGLKWSIDKEHFSFYTFSEYSKPLLSIFQPPRFI